MAFAPTALAPMVLLQKNSNPATLDDRSRKKGRFRPLNDEISLLSDQMTIHSNPSFNKVLLSSEGEKTNPDVNSDNENESMDENDADMAEEDADFELDDEVQFGLRIEYEGLPRSCFNCGMYNHTKEVCTKQAVSSALKEFPQESTRGIEAEESIYGPWMIASRRKQRRNESRSNQRVTSTINRVEHKGSRFSILDDISHDPTNEDQNGSHIGERLSDERSTKPTPNVIASQKNLINTSNNVIQGNPPTNKATANIDCMDANNKGNEIRKAKTNDKFNQELDSIMDVDLSSVIQLTITLDLSRNSVSDYALGIAKGQVIKFFRVVKDLVKSYAINMLILLKPRINKPNAFWFFTVVYGNPSPNIRCQLWEELSSFESTVTGPWLLASDFNAFLHSHEKTGGFP
ncbi:Uncharacterized protein TCM_022921 [Theobroma cacao]|uniref:Uncharacterized protein n=1 Tax=Theobroma cacao TaxID=3641 RepID=A0A061ETR1_THECC|nr:Uncharacterized protein TCM_022921 [Theobroma cacao]